MRPERPVVAHHFEAMGTRCAIFTSGRPCFDGEEWVHIMAARLTRFSPESELSHLNATAGEWIAISPELEAVLRAAEHAYELSSGLVNVAVLPSLLAAGYTRTFREGPATAVLERARPAPSLPAVLEVQAGRARLQPGAGLDLGGIAKGWMADRLAELLDRECVVNLGGDLRVIGTWPIGFGET